MADITPEYSRNPAIHIAISAWGHGKQAYPYLDPDAWFAEHAPRDGSWWPAWSTWLGARSGAIVEPPSLGNSAAGYPALEDAPGRYVFMK
jgi:polyhydroxyalkanoate synthase